MKLRKPPVKVNGIGFSSDVGMYRKQNRRVTYSTLVFYKIDLPKSKAKNLDLVKIELSVPKKELSFPIPSYTPISAGV